MWTWLLIILVIATALAPLSHFAPSKRQRAVAGMREFAALNGLYVEFRDTPGAVSKGARGSVIYYGKRLPAALAADVSRTAWARQEAAWRCVTGRTAAPDMLSALPDGILAASIDAASCGVYWREEVEKGQEKQAVAQIQQVLDSWIRSLSE